MPPAHSYQVEQPSRTHIDALRGTTVLEFGTDWCGFCLGAQALIQEALAENTPDQHLKVEDGPGRALGRSYRVKLWPTLIFLKDGEELARVVRPSSPREVSDAMHKLAT